MKLLDYREVFSFISEGHFMTSLVFDNGLYKVIHEGEVVFKSKDYDMARERALEYLPKRGTNESR